MVLMANNNKYYLFLLNLLLLEQIKDAKGHFVKKLKNKKFKT